MKKCIVIFAVFMLSSAVLFSNPGIMGKHKGELKNGKKIDCAYCHFSGPKIAQQKGQIKNGKLKGRKYSRIKGCGGQGCHD
ncbi:MAG TPA: hypothetical protein PK358_04415 [Spirochaetota bacterium]|nr:hypothetical protein [Spirochaetota bacterium]HPJ34054.1 hypothetical protein [Spirochaetota bacterium]